MHSVTKEGHARAEIEVKDQVSDFGIETVRDIKLYNNFGINFGFEKNTNTSYIRYRKSIMDLISGFRNTGTTEGLYNIVRAFYRITPQIESLAQTGWRYGRNRLGYAQSAQSLTVTAVPIGPERYYTFTTSSSGLDVDHTGDYIAFVSVPTGVVFNQSLYGEMFSVINYSTSGGNATFTIESIDYEIPVGAVVQLFNTDTSTNFNTSPHSTLSYTFGARVTVHGPYLDDTDKTSFETLLRKFMPLHVDYITTYQPIVLGESSWDKWMGDKTNLEVNYETNTLVPVVDSLLEYSRLSDNFNSTVTTVVSGDYVFTGDNITTKYNYYKNKDILFLTGNNAGISKRVLSYLGGEKQFTTDSFPYTIMPGDIFRVEHIAYQTKYVTPLINIQPVELGINLTNSLYTFGWFTRKLDPAIEEYLYIESSDDGVIYTLPRRVQQNERLNTTVDGTVTVGIGSYPYNTFTISASGLNHLSNIDDYYAGSYLKFTTGVNASYYEKILSYDATTKVVVTDTFSSLIDTGDNFTIITTDIKQYVRVTAYHNKLKNKNDIEIESIVIKVI